MNAILEKFILKNSRASTAIINGEEYLYFGGTSYYELHRNEQVVNSAIDVLKKFGTTTASSRNSFGNHELIVELENEAAEFFETEDSVYLSSGFLTASALIQFLYEKNYFDSIFIDEFTHYASKLAIKISDKKIIPFRHLNAFDLEEKLISYSQFQKPLIVTDGIFPIFGNIAPLDLYFKIAERYNGCIFIDDAHGIGVLGEKGKGTLEHFNIKSDKIFFGGTFSKAFGGYGGIIPTYKLIAEEIKNSSIVNGATPTPLPAVSASLAGLKIFKSDQKLKSKLWENAIYLKSEISKLGINVNQSPVPIVAWDMNNSKDMDSVIDELIKKKIIIQKTNYIGSGENGVLRIVVFSTHTKEQIDYLISTLKKII
ncbi:MAG: pyridoxal phosphate-dependent aminotransferase family protein [Stygiobacter sp.]